MVGLEEIFSYFPDLTSDQQEKFKSLGPLYSWHNERVNVISRKDIDQFYIHHVLHSLALVKISTFKPGQSVIDIGTCGGFPGIPLAIMYPEVQFTLVDSIGKKIRVVNDVISSLGIENAMAVNTRTESIGMKFDIATARAVAPMLQLWNWMEGNWKKSPAFYLLKGGDLTAETDELLSVKPKLQVSVLPISDFFKEEFFETKKIVSIF